MLDPDIETLVRMGDVIGAIGLYQQRHGGSTLVARRAIDAAVRALDREQPAAPEPDPEPGPLTVVTDPALAGFVRSGEKIAAIKRYRELHGVGLKEAKDAVEAMQAGRPVQHPPPVHVEPERPTLQPELDRLIAANDKIGAIRHVRTVVENIGLREAKDAVEARMAELGL